MKGLSIGAQIVHRPTPLETPCIVTRGPLDTEGYGLKLTDERRKDGRRKYRKLHRWVVEQSIGRQLGPDEVVMHRCDNPPCYRLDHLVIGTPAENNADRTRKGRTHRHATWTGPHLIGQDHARAKLTDEQVFAIRRLIANGGITQRDIAERFGVSPALITRIKQGRLWTHITIDGHEADALSAQAYREVVDIIRKYESSIDVLSLLRWIVQDKAA